jgi:signal transduction histidine kinase/DNA-binding NarL/FixJ family response regulator
MAQNWTLIIVDDSAADRKIYRRYLLKDPHLSYQIFEADSAEDGLVLCQKNQCDVILLDYCLPDMTGLDFLERLQPHIINTHATVVMLTGHGDEAVAVEAMKRGVKDYVVKQHLKPDVLQLTVRNAIEKSYLQAQLHRTRERQRLIATTALRIRQSLNLEQILHTAVTEVHQLLKCDGVLVYQFATDKGGKTIASSVESSMAVVDEKNTPAICCQQRVGKNNNQEYLPGISPACAVEERNGCAHILQQSNSKQNLVVPIILPKNGNPKPKSWGLLIALQSSQKREWQPDEKEILTEVSVQLAIAIQQAEMLAQTQAALEKEKHLNVFKSQIIATVSHEYRTPLTSILTAASTLKQHGQHLDENRQKRFLQMIEDKARHLSKIVNDMLLVNQIELDKTKFKPAPLDLLHFFSDLMEELRLTADDSHKLVFKITGNNKGFWGDRGLLRQVFVNLMSNAIKYSPNGGNIELHLIGQETQVIFSIQDEGIGIPKKDLENLFQSFRRGSNVDTIPGTGLGLLISKACIDLHGGDITLESQQGQGTKVTVSLPKRPIAMLNP